ncbi:unnamed protein product [Diamesa hyperborea]
MFRLSKLQVNSLGARPSSRSVMTSHLLTLSRNLKKQVIDEEFSTYGPFLRSPSSTSFVYYNNVDVENKKSADVIVKSKLNETFGMNCGNKFHPLLLNPHNKLSLLADILEDKEYSSPNSTLTSDITRGRKIIIQDDYQDVFAQFKSQKTDDIELKIKQDLQTGKTIIEPLDLEYILSKNKPSKKISPIDKVNTWTRFEHRNLELKHIKSKIASHLVPKSLKLQTDAEKKIQELEMKELKPKSFKSEDFKPLTMTLNKNKPIESFSKTLVRDQIAQRDQTIFKPSKQSQKKVLKIPQQQILFNKTKMSLKYIPKMEMTTLPPSAVSVPLSSSQKKFFVPDLPEKPNKILITETKSPTVPFSSTGTAKQIQRKASKKQVQIFEMKLPRIVRSQEAIDKNGIFSLKSILRAQQSNVSLKRN